MYQSSHLEEFQEPLFESIKRNCEISDAHDHGVYSMCRMVLKLRNLYKWEQEIEPWKEPEPGDLLDWIEEKENSWEDETADEFLQLRIGEIEVSPFDIEVVNKALEGTGLYYGAGYGRSMKSVFFVAEEVDRSEIKECPVIVLGREHIRDMAAPFAMSQGGSVIIRLEPLRYFLWDHFQELQTTCKSSYIFLAKSYDLLTEGKLDQGKLRDSLADIVENELGLFIYHEIGEIRETALDSERARRVIARFPGSVIEFVCRAVKDVLADTNSDGVLSYICRERKPSALALYVSFLDGLRHELFPEMNDAWKTFYKSENWSVIEKAGSDCRKRLLEIAAAITSIVDRSESFSDRELVEKFNEDVLVPMGLEMPIEAITSEVEAE